MKKHFDAGCTVGDVVAFLETLPQGTPFKARDYMGDWSFQHIEIEKVGQSVYVESNVDPDEVILDLDERGVV